MHTETPAASIRDLLSNVLKENPTWVDLADAIADVFKNNVEKPIDQLGQLRFIRQDNDRKVLEASARLLGFDLTQDIFNLTSDSLTKITTQLPLYSRYNSTERFHNFLEVILASKIEVEYLYTEDYISFYQNPRGPLITSGGRWFKTTHINLGVNVQNLGLLELAEGDVLIERIKRTIFSFAPIVLTLKDFFLTLDFFDSGFVGGHAFGVGAFLDDSAPIEHTIG